MKKEQKETKRLLEKISLTVLKHSMLMGGETVLVGLSGGPDSVCLLRALKMLSGKYDIKLCAVYVDHGLRPGETGKEIQFCKNLCESLNVPFMIKKIDVKGLADARGLNKQEAGRILRYDAFETSAFEAKASKIALGHNLDDQVETFFMRVLRGSGMKGLSGIPPVRGKIIRPLFETSRAEIEKFLSEEGASYMVDSSNLKTDYARNKLRSTLMPVLKGLSPGFIETIGGTAEIIGEEDAYLEVAVTKALMKLITRKTDKTIELFITPLEIMDRVILRRVIRRAINETSGLRGLGLVHVESILRLIKTGKAGDRIYLPKGVRAIKKYATLVMTSEIQAKMRTYELGHEGTVVIKEAGLAIESRPYDRDEKADGKASAVFDAGKLTFPLIIRPREDGDFFYPRGLGGRKKLQDFFTDEKIPRDERDAVPIVVSGGEIIWVAGMRDDERFALAEDSAKGVLLALIRL